MKISYHRQDSFSMIQTITLTNMINISFWFIETWNGFNDLHQSTEEIKAIKQNQNKQQIRSDQQRSNQIHSKPVQYDHLRSNIDESNPTN
jgi:hypothetical protein